MAELAGLKAFFQLIGGTYYGYVLYINYDNAKGWILMIGAVVFGIQTYVYRRKKHKVNLRKDEQAIREKEYELIEMERQKRIRDRQESTTQQP